MASSDLPEIIVALILRHVSQKQRLQHCALVSTVWAAAARAATDSLDLVLKDDNSNISVIDWIQSHGNSLTSLRLGHVRYNVIPADAQQQLSLLPCPQLRSLELCNISISLQLSSSSSLLLLSAATGLTRLVPTDVSAAAGGSSSSAAVPTENLMALSALTALQHLEVDSLVFTGLDVKIAYRADLLTLPSALVPCLTQVKHLVLHDALTEVWALEQLSCLTGLASLGVGLSWGGLFNTPDTNPVIAATAAALQHLSSLTALSLTGSSLHLFFDPAVGQSCFSALTQLRSLQIHSTSSARSLDPAALTMLTDLQHLDVSLQCALNRAQALELLSWLPQLQDLTYLRLSGVLRLEAPAPASAYAALTASSNLQHLDLSNCRLVDESPVFAATPWQDVFARGRLLPHLTSLQLNGSKPGLGFRSMQYLMRCCPALQRLDLSTQGLKMGGFYDLELTGLSGLTQLTSFTGRIVGQHAAGQLLKGMTQLRELDLTCTTVLANLGGSGRAVGVQPGPVWGRALLPLTQLRQLESLTVQLEAEVVQDGGTKPKLELRSTAAEGSPPDVWSQLRGVVAEAANAESWLQGAFSAVSFIWHNRIWRACMEVVGIIPAVICVVLLWRYFRDALTVGTLSTTEHVAMWYLVLVVTMVYCTRWFERSR